MNKLKRHCLLISIKKNNQKKKINWNSYIFFESIIDQKIKLSPKRFSKYFKKIICKDFIYKQNTKNIMQIPKIDKIIVNTTSKLFVIDKKYIIPAFFALELITGYKLKKTKAKKNIANFKLRKKQLIGCNVCLTGNYMHNFFEKIVTILSFNFIDYNLQSKFYSYTTLGFSDLLFFPELENHYEFFSFLRGINISIITSTTSKAKSKILLSGFQLPLPK